MTKQNSVFQKINTLFHKYREIIVYLIVGVLTTIISLLTYYICVFTFLDPNNAFELQVANIISWCFAVVFAYFTNRKYVFQSKNANILKEGISFSLSRVITLVIDMLLMFLLVTTWKFNDKISKLIVQVVVTVGNYIISKFFVFNKRKKIPTLTVFKNCCIIFFVSTILGVGLLTIAYSLPDDIIYNNAKTSANVFSKEGTYGQLIEGYENSQLDNYTDALIMGEVIYSGEESALNKAMKVYRYANDNPVDDFIGVVNNETYDYNSYERYWHGNIFFVRLAFLFFDYNSLRVVNIAVQFILVVSILYLMFKQNLKRYIVPFGISLLLIMPFTIGFSLQFSSVYYVTLIASIVILKNNDWLKKRNYHLYVFLIDGILVSYLDLLTFPALALGIPLIFYLILNNKNLKDSIFDIIKFSFMWGLGYFGMWFLKWIVGSLICQENFLTIALNTAKYRTEASTGRINSILTNIMVYYKKGYLFIGLLTVIYYVFTFIKNKCRFTKEKFRNLIPYLIVMLIPIVWYFVFSQHSTVHYWFTNKSLMVSFFAGLVVVANITSKKEIKK